MNHEAQKQLLEYMAKDLKDLNNTQLEEYQWLVEQQLQEILQTIVARRPPWELNNPGPTPGSRRREYGR